MIRHQVPLAPYVTLRLGGVADEFVEAKSANELAEIVTRAPLEQPLTVIGWGSNVLPSDHGVDGLVIRNLSNGLTMDGDGDVVADSGLSFQDLFLKTAQAGWAGFEYAVGIPGSLGGAMVSNAGAYRSQVSEFLTELDVVVDGQRRWVKPDWMQFSYRNSALRQSNPPRATIIRARFRLPKGDRWKSFQEAREYQRQRISKQPPSPSAGSFFKNVENHELAAQIPALPTALKEKGVVPAGFLIEAVGFKGKRHGGVGWGQRHANFMLNLNRGSATEVAELAQLTIETVRSNYGVTLESEVLYLGRWPRD
jgi:UDP-N-acetylmuramate dehydrogenase